MSSTCSRHSAPPRRRRRVRRWALLVALGVATGAGGGAARAQTVDLERSVFALLTHKGGFAKGRAHDHVIVAGGASAGTAVELVWTGSAEDASFRLAARAEELEVDPPHARSELRQRFEDLGLRSGDFHDIDDDQRAKVRVSMLGRKQLDAERFPEIAVRLRELRAEPSTVGSVEMSHRGVVELTAHGETARVAFAGRVEREGDELRFEATGRLRFGDLGIEPFSAFLGAVKNLDEIDLYLRLVAGAPPQP